MDSAPAGRGSPCENADQCHFFHGLGGLAVGGTLEHGQLAQKAARPHDIQHHIATVYGMADQLDAAHPDDKQILRRIALEEDVGIALETNTREQGGNLIPVFFPQRREEGDAADDLHHVQLKFVRSDIRWLLVRLSAGKELGCGGWNKPLATQVLASSDGAASCRGWVQLKRSDAVTQEGGGSQAKPL